MLAKRPAKGSLILRKKRKLGNRVKLGYDKIRVFIRDGAVYADSLKRVLATCLRRDFVSKSYDVICQHRFVEAFQSEVAH